MGEWIAVADRLPEQREKPYQVIALCVKRYKEMCYAGEPIRGIYQDWVLRNWPQNYSHWMPFPALPADGVIGLQAQPFFTAAEIAKGTMTPEQEAAVRDRNWCWKCASAMVVDVHRDAGMRFMQCKHCKTVYCLSDSAKEDQRG